MLRIEHMDDDFVRRAFGKGPQGDLFKSVGGRWDEGPYGYSDIRPLQEYCGYSARPALRGQLPRATNEDWKSGGAEMRKLIEDLNGRPGGRAAGHPHVLRDNFDLKALTNYMAVINWMVAWDDQYHNHYFYKRPGDGRWMMLPTDLDNVMGGSALPRRRLVLRGPMANRSNRNDYWS